MGSVTPQVFDRRFRSVSALRASSLLLLVLTAGCTSSSLDFVEVHGRFADGNVIDGRTVPNVGVVPSLQPQVGIVMAVGAPINGPEDFRGVRLEWVQTAVAVGGSYPSSPDGPVLFYVVGAPPDGGAVDTISSVVNGGTITFTGIAKSTTGTFSGLVLSRGGQTLLTIDSGAFQATQP
ncbi:MAG: hypothetical protein JWN44_3974 [Myxococcales bacterium]|nr:hypothetical protein [Myxococcales bacterium]